MAIAFLLLPLFINAQTKIFKEEYNFNTKLKIKNDEADRIIITIFDEKIYTLAHRGSFDKDGLTINKFDTKTMSNEVILIKKNPSTKTIFNQYIDAFAIRNNKIILLTGQNIYILYNTKGAEFKLVKTIKNNGSFTNLLNMSESELLCYVNYNYHPLDEPNKHTWAKLYLGNDSLGMEKRMDDNNVLFGYFVNAWVSTYKGVIAYSHTTDYSIRLYNDQFELIDSIKSNELIHNQDKLKFLPKGNNHSVDEMNKIRQIDDSLFTRIEKVFLIDSLNLLVTVKKSNSMYYKIDLWTKINSAWTLSKSGSYERFFIEGKEYNEGNNTLIGFFDNVNGLVYAGKGEFYYYYYPYTKNMVTNSFDKQTDYYNVTNELVRKKELYFGIKKLKVLTN